MMKVGSAEGMIEKLQGFKAKIEELSSLFKDKVWHMPLTTREVFNCMSPVAEQHHVCLRVHCRVSLALRD